MDGNVYEIKFLAQIYIKTDAIIFKFLNQILRLFQLMLTKVYIDLLEM